jgi:acetyl-CoA carboxylase carboxyl transferase subunit beta
MEQAIDAWEAVAAARSPERPTAPDLAHAMSDAIVELHGDRAGSDDRFLVAALARVRGRRVVLLALDRAGAPAAGAFRKARRCIALARRLGLPIVTLVDTPGADPSEPSEARGIAWEIAGLFDDMLAADVPIISVVTGEGGSGGALAFATGDVMLVYEHSIFSVIGPEAAAAILWRDPERAPDAARALKLTAADLVRLGIADHLLPEPVTSASVADAVAYHLDRITGGAPKGAAAARRKRWRNLGH